jgi:hypothetical protein
VASDLLKLDHKFPFRGYNPSLLVSGRTGYYVLRPYPRSLYGRNSRTVRKA